MEDKKILGLNKNIFFMGLTSFFTDISSEMIYPLIPIFLTTILGVPVSFVGLIEGIAGSTASLLKALSGWFSDRIQARKKLTIIGYGLSAISKPILVFSFSWWHVLIARFSDRVGKGIRTSPRDALIADSAGKDDYGKSFGFHRGMDTLGAAIGPLLALFLLPLLNNNYRAYFSLAIIPASIGVVILYLFVQENIKKAKRETPKLSLKQFDNQFKFFLIVIFVFTLGNSSNAFLILRAQNVGISIGLIPLVYFVFNVVYAIFSVPVGILSDKINRKVVMISGFLIFSLVYLGFALAKNVFAIWILFASYGLYYAFTESIFKAYTADLVPKDLRGTAYGFLNLIMGITLFPASFIAGIMWEKISPQAPFYYGSLMSMLSLFLFLAFIISQRYFRRKIN